MTTPFTQWDVRRVLAEELQAAVDTQDGNLIKRVVLDLYYNEAHGDLEDGGIFAAWKDQWRQRFAWVPEYIAERKDEE